MAQAIHGLFNAEPGGAPPLTTTAKRFKSDVEALGGDAHINVTRRGFFGTFGQRAKRACSTPLRPSVAKPG